MGVMLNSGQVAAGGGGGGGGGRGLPRLVDRKAFRVGKLRLAVCPVKASLASASSATAFAWPLPLPQGGRPTGPEKQRPLTRGWTGKRSAHRPPVRGHPNSSVPT